MTAIAVAPVRRRAILSFQKLAQEEGCMPVRLYQDVYLSRQTYKSSPEKIQKAQESWPSNRYFE